MGPVPDEKALEERVIDEKLWRANCLDLKRVMHVAKSVYLLLEHSNEACVRLGVELVTDPKAKKTLFWNDNWFSDEKKYDHFKALVRKKLELVLCSLKGVPLSQLEGDDEDGVDQNEFEALKKKLAESEAAAKAAKLQQQNLERMCQAAQAGEQEAKDRAAALEKSLEEMRKKVREAEDAAAAALKDAAAARADADAADSRAKAAESMAKNKPAAAPPPPKQEPEKKAAEPEVKIVKESSPEDKKKILELERALKKGEEERDALRKQIRELESRASKHAAELEAAKRNGSRQKEPEVERPAAVAAPKVEEGVKEEEYKKVVEKLNDERKLSKGLQGELDKSKADLRAVEKKLAAAEDRAAAAEKMVESLQEKIKQLERQLKFAGQAAPATPERKKKVEEPADDERERTKSNNDQNGDIEELRRKAARVDELLDKLKARDAKIAKLEEENAQLKEDKMRMARQLAQVRDQLRRMTELAEKKGCGALIKEIMEEAEVLDTVNSEEYSCFARLWDDALRRQKKQKVLDALRAGGVSPEEAEAAASAHKPTNFLRRGRRATVVGVGGGSDYGDSDGGRSRSGSPHRHSLASLAGGEDFMDATDSFLNTEGRFSQGHSGGSYKVGYDAGYRAGYEAARAEDANRVGSPAERMTGQFVGAGYGNAGMFIVGHSFLAGQERSGSRRPSVSPRTLLAQQYASAGGSNNSTPRANKPRGRSASKEREASMGKRTSLMSFPGPDSPLMQHPRRPSVAGGGGGAYRGLMLPDTGGASPGHRDNSPAGGSRPTSRMSLVKAGGSPRHEAHDAPLLLPSSMSAPGSPTVLHGSASSPTMHRAGGGVPGNGGLSRTGSSVLQGHTGGTIGFGGEPMVRGQGFGGPMGRQSTLRDVQLGGGIPGASIPMTTSKSSGTSYLPGASAGSMLRSRFTLAHQKSAPDGLPQIGGDVSRRRALIEAGDGSPTLSRAGTTNFGENDLVVRNSLATHY